MEKTATFEEAIDVVDHLSLVDKVRLIEYIAPQITQGLTVEQPSSRKSLRGLWKGIDLPESDIDEARREMWGKFPHEDMV